MANSRLSAYVPEPSAFAQKDARSSRRFFEEVAVIDGKTLRLLAARGTEIALNEPLGTYLQASLSPQELTAQLLTCARLLLPTQKGSLLLFGDFLKETGLLLGAFFPVSANAVATALNHLGRSDIQASLCQPCRLDFEEKTLICVSLCEIFYYVDRFFTRSADMGIPTLGHAVADFTGCRVIHVSGSVAPPALSPQSRSALIFYLLCGMLTLRGRTGVLEVVGEQRSQKNAFELRVEVSELGGKPEKKKSDGGDPLFLSAECFSGVEWNVPDGNAVLDVSFPLYDSKNVLFAANVAMTRVRMRLYSIS